MGTCEKKPLDISKERDYAVITRGNMKLRRIGNSLGTTFSKELLERSGLKEDDELEIQATPGEIRIRRASSQLVVELTEPEAKALASGNVDTRAWHSAIAKVRRLVEPKGT
jgi:putative addiction module antidote